MDAREVDLDACLVGRLKWETSDEIGKGSPEELPLGGYGRETHSSNAKQGKDAATVIDENELQYFRQSVDKTG